MAILALVAFGVAAYTYLVYPALIFLLGRLWPQPMREDPSYLPTVTVCVPVHNAASYLRRKVESLRALDYPEEKLEFLLFSDGSTDDTSDVANAFAAGDDRIRVVASERRRGKPNALNEMRERARGEVLLLTDVRQPLEPGALKALLRRLADPSVGCVSGNLVLKGETGAGFYWRYENFIREAEARFRSMVGVTGPIYAVRRADLEPVPPDIILDDVWVPMRLRLAGRRILFAKDAVAYEDAFGDEREFGRKTRTLAGNYQIFRMMPQLLTPLRNASWFETISHKLFRLLCPWALVAMLVASVTAVARQDPSVTQAPLLAWTLRALVAGQALFYLLAAGGVRLGPPGRIARTFVMMNWAAVVGLWRFLTGRQKVTW